jgi:hypothetical protein
MGFFTPRERAELGKSAEMRGQGKARELVRQDFAPRGRPRPADPDISGHVGTLVTRVAASSVQEIDDLIVRLQQRREQLISESARVQREILEYAALSQTTMQSTKIIRESLTQFNKVPDPLPVNGPQVQDVPPAAEQHKGKAAEQHNGKAAQRDNGETNAEQRNGTGEPPAQHDEVASTPDSNPEDAGERRSETI